MQICMKTEEIKEIQIQAHHDTKNIDLEKKIRHIPIRVEPMEDAIIMIKIHPDLVEKMYRGKLMIILLK